MHTLQSSLLKRITVAAFGSLLVGALLSGCGSAEQSVAAESTGDGAAAADVLAHYIPIQVALAADSHEGVAAHASSLAEALSARGADALRVSAESLAAADGLEEARAAFEDVSIGMIAFLKENSAGGSEYHEVHCPMAFNNQGASWVQAGREIRNPYHGSSMLTCGVVRASL